MALPDFALSVGIDVYPGLTPLHGAERDAKAFHAWALSSGVAPAHAKLIVSSDFPAPANPSQALPGSQEIWNFFELLRTEAVNNNNANLGFMAGRRLYMFFSGHGFSPSIDESAVLMANAERDTPHNLSPKVWADRFYDNGLFQEVMLFQDACREPADDVDIPPPYFKKSLMPGGQQRRRFYAMAAKSPLLALEKDVGGGEVRGIFSATLMEGLRGAARDSKTGDITADTLRQYLRDNMAGRLTPTELADEDLAQWPDVYGSEPIVIVPSAAFAGGGGGGAAPAAAGPQLFPVQIALPGAKAAEVLDSGRQKVRSTGPGSAVWSTDLPIGFFEVVVDGIKATRLFKVTGSVAADGTPEVVHVD
jgi:hypothetical protein